MRWNGFGGLVGVGCGMGRDWIQIIDCRIMFAVLNVGFIFQF